MWQAGTNGNLGRPRRELAFLLVASLVVVAGLVVAIADDRTLALSAQQTRIILLLGIGLGGALLAAARLHRASGRLGGNRGDTADEAVELRKNLLTAETVIKAEPQVLVFWEQGQGVRVMVHTLAGVPGLPHGHAELLKFGKWLDLDSAQELKKGLDQLFSEGHPFSLLLKTAGGGVVEADGRAAGGRAILRLRDVAGRKRDLARILDQHRQLVRDTLAGRTLLDALPMAAWFRGRDGRIQWVNEAYVKAVDAGSEEEVRARQIELLEARQREAVAAALTKGQAFRERVH
ncbi:MAG TPA: PAS domain-containing protein, partial [Hyphomicrobiaceae bacterium]|nr:PAS domain-containing protein [Hyphomicrobiaceae bacterium]